MKGGFFLLKRFIKSQGGVFVAELIATFLVFLIITNVLSLMNGIQEKQIESIKNVLSFPLIIENVNKETSKMLSDDIRKDHPSLNMYAYKDYRLFSPISNKTAILRKATSSYYSSFVFTSSYFYYFPQSKLESGAVLLPYYNTENSYYYIDKGESGGDIIKTFAPHSTESYFPLFTSYEDVFYEENDAYFENENNLYSLGVEGSEKEISEFKAELLKNHPSLTLSSYKTEQSDIYSALVIERIMLFAVMLFLIFIVFLSFQRSIKNLMFKKRGEVVLLRAFGKTRKEIFALFLEAYTLPLLFSEVAATLLGVLAIKKNLPQKLLSLLHLSWGDNIAFIPKANELTYMVFISFLIYLILMLFSINSLTKTDMHEVAEE